MTHETATVLPPEEVLRRAKEFFATRVPARSAFVERESARHVALRGQGGEEIVIAAVPGPGGTAVTGSTLLFDQELGRFFSTLPEPAAEGVAP
jgi:hypothetical protein